MHEFEHDQGQASPHLLLAALANNDRLNVVMKLFEGPCTQKELTALLEVNSGTMSRQMLILEDAGLVTRESSHNPYSLVAPKETLELLSAAAGIRRQTAAKWLDCLEGLNGTPDQQ